MFRSLAVGVVAVVLIANASNGFRRLTTHWKDREETVAFRPTVTKSYEIRTENGTIDFGGLDDLTKDAEITAVCKASSFNIDRAQEALNAIEVTIDGKDKEVCQIGWRWRTPKQPDWSGTVDFKVSAPKNVAVQADASNGQIIVKNLAGNAKIVSHNGQLDADTSGDSLSAETNNGQVKAKFAGRKIKLKCSNGQVVADLTRCRQIEGEISTNNGNVRVEFGKETSCEMTSSTSHGVVIEDSHRKHQRWPRRSVSERLGSGGGKLELTTRNGVIHIDRHDSDD